MSLMGGVLYHAICRFFDVSDGRCGIIVSIPDHCLPFYFLYIRKKKKEKKKISFISF